MKLVENLKILQRHSSLTAVVDYGGCQISAKSLPNQKIIETQEKLAQVWMTRNAIILI